MSRSTSSSLGRPGSALMSPYVAATDKAMVMRRSFIGTSVEGRPRRVSGRGANRPRVRPGPPLVASPGQFEVGQVALIQTPLGEGRHGVDTPTTSGPGPGV